MFLDILEVIGICLAYWAFGIVLVIIGYMIFMKTGFFDADDDRIDTEDWGHIGWVALIAFLWPIALGITIISVVVFGAAQVLKFVLTKVVD